MNTNKMYYDMFMYYAKNLKTVKINLEPKSREEIGI